MKKTTTWSWCGDSENESGDLILFSGTSNELKIPLPNFSIAHSLMNAIENRIDSERTVERRLVFSKINELNH
jgi:hypothetical protein